MVGDLCSVALWYQEEPHAKFPALPPAAHRHVAVPWVNVLQHALLALAVAAALAAGVVVALAVVRSLVASYR